MSDIKFASSPFIARFPYKKYFSPLPILTDSYRFLPYSTD